MTEWLLSVYDALKTRRVVRWLSLAVLTALMVVLTARQTYQEDISAFLPMDAESQQAMKDFERHSGADRIVAIFEQQPADGRPADVEPLTAAIDAFVERLEQRDSLHAVSDVMTQVDMEQMAQMADYLYDNISSFLTPADYARMDSLLRQPDYVTQQMANCKQMLLFPVSGLFAQHFQRDPLNLFTPVVARLRQDAQGPSFEERDGYLVSPDGLRAIIIMRSSYGASETENNGLLLSLLQKTAEDTSEQFSSIDIRFIGGPVVAVGNARQIKSDSMLAVTLAVVLIVTLLFFVFRRVWPLLLIVISIGWGWLFAMGMLAVVHDSVSLIVIGISSVILGIAVNYPLHLIAHLQHAADVRSALKEIVMPLVVGNITTVGAFMALLPLESAALRDLGLFSALLLVGTILFVLLYLPHLVSRSSFQTPRFLQLLGGITLPDNRWLLALVAVLTVLLGYFSLQTSFDADMSHINYMTPQQRADMALLGAAGAEGGLSAVAQTDTAAAARWNTFVAQHADSLQRRVEAAAAAEGFAPGTFDAFYRTLSARSSAVGGGQSTLSSFSSQLVQRLSDDFNYIGVACGCIVFFFLWFSLGSIELALLSFLPMAVSWLWILGLMALLGIQFNVVNIILATFIFGQGDDYTIFMTEGCQYEYAYRRSMLSSYKQSIILSAVIMFIGIGTLIIARHPALQSLAQVTIIGMATVVLMAWVIPPFIFRWLTTDGRGHERRQPVTLRRLLRLGRADDVYRLVSDRYRYRGVEISFAVDRRLRYLHRHPDALPEALELSDEGWGETALLLALMHPDKTFTVALSDADRLLVARHAAEGVAGNVRFQGSYRS